MLLTTADLTDNRRFAQPRRPGAAGLGGRHL
jgi:hypothetical protein